MLYIFKDVILKNEEFLTVSLKKVFGFNSVRASNFCDSIGFSRFVKVGNLNRYQFFLTNNLLKKNYGTENFLVRKRDNNLKFFLSMKTYKSIRLQTGLPIRGQRTRTNAKTTKRTKLLKKKK